MLFRPTAGTIVAAVGGLLAFVGAFLTWFDVSVSFEGVGPVRPAGYPPRGTFSGEETTTASGTEDWTGPEMGVVPTG